jgi:hypothetical protein
MQTTPVAMSLRVRRVFSTSALPAVAIPSSSVLDREKSADLRRIPAAGGERCRQEGSDAGLNVSDPRSSTNRVTQPVWASIAPA